VAPTAGLTLGATLLAAGDSASFGFTGATYDTRNVGSGKTVTVSGINFTSNPNNYVLASRQRTRRLEP
jgi:hypothetical protein